MRGQRELQHLLLISDMWEELHRRAGVTFHSV